MPNVVSQKRVLFEFYCFYVLRTEENGGTKLVCEGYFRIIKRLTLKSAQYCHLTQAKSKALSMKTCNGRTNERKKEYD